jgi:hypothetical protein
MSNIFDLVDTMKDKSFGMSDHETLKLLASVIGPNIKYSYEIENDFIHVDYPDSAATEQDEGHESDETQEEKKQCNESKIKRYVLTSNRLKADFSNVLVRQCNGVVLDSEWNIISLPPPMFCPKFKYNKINKTLGDYHIYKIKDGTTITLYYFNNKWSMSTTNGYDVSDFKWIGDKTYMEHFSTLMEKYDGFTFDSLDRNLSYTFGFRVNDFHPFGESEGIWFIRSFDTVMKEISNNFLINGKKVIQVQEMENYNINKKTFNWLMNNNREAMNNYLESKTNKNPFIHYGYVLRSKTQENPDIVLESELLKFIRKCVYNIPRLSFITHENRLSYIILREFLSTKTRQDFIAVFSPKFDAEFTKLKSRFDIVVEDLIKILSMKGYRNDVFKMDTPYNEILTALCTSIESNTKLFPFDQNISSIITDHIITTKFINLYFPLLTKNFE